MAINIKKNQDKKENCSSSIIETRKTAIAQFFEVLETPNIDFECNTCFDLLVEYLITYERILYTPISNVIYYLSSENEDVIATIMSNLEKMLEYTESDEYNEHISQYDESQKNKCHDAIKSIIKILDHVNLAQQQYQVLKQTDQEYADKFNSNIEKYKQEMTKEMSQQLISLVGIFTALAFLIFGSISSLDNIFSVHGIPLLKLMCVGTIWGICILNLVFVFLFCVSKMTKTQFKSTEDPRATIFQKYPIVWWCNFTLCSLLLIFCWFYYLTSHELFVWFSDFMELHVSIKVIIVTIIICIVIFFAFRSLCKKTKALEPNKED